MNSTPSGSSSGAKRPQSAAAIAAGLVLAAELCYFSQTCAIKRQQRTSAAML